MPDLETTLVPWLDVNGVLVFHGDCVGVMAAMPDASVDAVVTDPPYGLEFMGNSWDAPWKSGVHAEARRRSDEMGDEAKRPFIAAGVSAYRAGSAFQEWCRTWATEALRVLKPGGHVVAFGGTRTYHRLTVGLEDAGFEIRDCLAWLYGSGFPKSHDVAKAIDKAAGRGRAGEVAAWDGWGTALKPAFEPAVLARKPLEGTVVGNVTEHGTGALNIDGCRIGTDSRFNPPTRKQATPSLGSFAMCSGQGSTVEGRWPANVILDSVAAGMLDEAVGERPSGSRRAGARKGLGYHGADGDGGPAIEGSTGGPSRFFYTAKASRSERVNHHPTVKPVALMRWLVRLVTPPGGIVLDPFAGSGTTGEAAINEGHRAILIERDAEYLDGIRTRLVTSHDKTEVK